MSRFKVLTGVYKSNADKRLSYHYFFGSTISICGKYRSLKKLDWERVEKLTFNDKYILLCSSCRRRLKYLGIEISDFL